MAKEAISRAKNCYGHDIGVSYAWAFLSFHLESSFLPGEDAEFVYQTTGLYMKEANERVQRMSQTQMSSTPILSTEIPLVGSTDKASEAHDEHVRKLIKHYSQVCSDLIKHQLTDASIATSEIALDAWTLGYCFGCMQGICQISNFKQYTEGLLFMTVAFDELLEGSGDLGKGSWVLGIAINQQGDPTLQEGVMQGGTDFMAYNENPDRLPTGFFNHLRQQR
jgi:hypothetical protein